jgi:outer membrane immunogenic protein
MKMHFPMPTALIAIGFVGAAHAADLPNVKGPPDFTPPPPVFSWTGFYVGGEVGGAWNNQGVSIVSPAVVDQANVSGSLNGGEVLGGGFAGFNYEFAPGWVAGIDGDFDWTHISSTATAPNLFASGAPVGSGGVSWSSNVDWLASVRGRFGYAVMPNALLYVTGGVAWARTGYSGLDAFVGGCPNCGSVSFGTTRTGFTVGAGVDWAPWNNNWIIKAEYRYYQFDGASSPAFFPGAPPALATTFYWRDPSIQTVRVGLSYKFDLFAPPAPVVAKY